VSIGYAATAQVACILNEIGVAVDAAQGCAVSQKRDREEEPAEGAERAVVVAAVGDGASSSNRPAVRDG